MYFIEVINRFNISAEEFSEIYMRKFEKNINRNYKKEYKNIK